MILCRVLGRCRRITERGERALGMDFEGFFSDGAWAFEGKKHSISENSALLDIPNEEVTFEL